MKLLSLVFVLIASAAYAGGVNPIGKFVHGQSTVEFTRSGAGFEVSIMIIASDECDFSGSVTRVSDTQFESRTQSDEWDNQARALVTKECVLTFNFKDRNTVSLSNNGNCTSSCGGGTGTSLYLEEAKRQ